MAQDSIALLRNRGEDRGIRSLRSGDMSRIHSGLPFRVSPVGVLRRYFLIRNSIRGTDYPAYEGNRSNTPPRPQAVVPVYPQQTPRYPERNPRSTYPYLLLRTVRLKASSNSPGCIPFSCAARGSYQRTGDQNRHEPLPGTEMGRSSYRRRRQEAEAGPKEGERREAELGGSETRKPGSPKERETKIH